MRLQKQAIVLILIVCEACTLSTSYMINEYMLPTNLDLKAYYVDHHPPRTQEQYRYVGRRHSNTIRVRNFRTVCKNWIQPWWQKKIHFVSFERFLLRLEFGGKECGSAFKVNQALFKIVIPLYSFGKWIWTTY